MQQRQLRLGDILDDYCPRERRLTNHAVVAMVGDEVKQTRCTTCDAEHEYKHARVPRQRKKSEPAALYAAAAAGAPKKVVHDAPSMPDEEASGHGATDDGEYGLPIEVPLDTPALTHSSEEVSQPETDSDSDQDSEDPDRVVEEGPVHRPLIRAQLPRTDGQPPTSRPGPDFTIRQPGGRAGRFRRPQRGPAVQGNRTNVGNFRGPSPRQHGRPPLMSHLTKRQGQGRKRSK